ncbi:CapA family protein, partial [Caloramator sp. ALD01]|uniref:CapA family protein n=1 Tax=Caloramator sp. ALD01 TaxID=1031288 RepID=UPI00041C9148
MKNKKIKFALILLSLLCFLNFNLAFAQNNNNSQEQNEVVEITISAAGDCTLGSDLSRGYKNSFMEEFYKQNKNYGYFFKNVKHIFEKDDLTIVNLEGTLTNATKMAEKDYRFKGLPEFTNILKQGNIEAVNLANNHTYDYLVKGYKDTVYYLEKSGIKYFGRENRTIVEVKGIKLGLLGYSGRIDSKALRNTIKNDIKYLKSKGASVVIVNFHWGEEKNYYANETQKSLGRFTIDCGADLVLGHHPHVIQGIEEYKGKKIIYSLGNFCFGGNKNPFDKDTFIYQQTFKFKEGKLVDSKSYKIIPCSVSSVKYRNNYQPTPLTGKDAQRVLDRIKMYSK